MTTPAWSRRSRPSKGRARGTGWSGEHCDKHHRGAYDPSRYSALELYAFLVLNKPSLDIPPPGRLRSAPQ